MIGIIANPNSRAHRRDPGRLHQLILTAAAALDAAVAYGPARILSDA